MTEDTNASAASAAALEQGLDTQHGSSQWPLWEVFVQEGKHGAPHEHVGSVHATDGEHALQNARDVYARRGSVASMWVVPSQLIVASTPEDRGPFYDPAEHKIYRHPHFYKVPIGVKGL